MCFEGLSSESARQTLTEALEAILQEASISHKLQVKQMARNKASVCYYCRAGYHLFTKHNVIYFIKLIQGLSSQSSRTTFLPLRRQAHQLVDQYLLPQCLGCSLLRSTVCSYKHVLALLFSKPDMDGSAYGSRVSSCESSIFGEKKCPLRDCIRSMSTSREPFTVEHPRTYVSVRAINIQISLTYGIRNEYPVQSGFHPVQLIRA